MLCTIIETEKVCSCNFSSFLSFAYLTKQAPLHLHCGYLFRESFINKLLPIQYLETIMEGDVVPRPYMNDLLMLSLLTAPECWLHQMELLYQKSYLRNWKTINSTNRMVLPERKTVWMKQFKKKKITRQNGWDFPFHFPDIFKNSPTFKLRDGYLNAFQQSLCISSLWTSQNAETKI